MYNSYNTSSPWFSYNNAPYPICVFPHYHFRLGQQARNEYFGQAIVGLIPPNSIISEDRVKHTVDFLTVDEHELLKVIETQDDLSHLLEPTSSNYIHSLLSLPFSLKFLFVLPFQQLPFYMDWVVGLTFTFRYVGRYS